MSILDKIGMKSIKTVLAVVVSLFVGNLLKFDLPYLTAINAMVAIQSTIYDSVSFGKDRVLGTIIGISIGIIIVAIPFKNFIITSIGIFIIIYACNLLNKRNTIVTAAIVYLSIIIFPSPKYNAISQTISITMGVLIAIIINLFLAPFQISNKLYKSYYELKEDIFSLCSRIFTTSEDIEIQDFNSKVETFKLLVESYNEGYFKIRDKNLEFQKIEALLKNIDGISFFLAEVIKLKDNDLREDNVNKINKLLNLDIKASDYENSQHSSLFNFHVDKLLCYLEALEAIENN